MAKAALRLATFTEERARVREDNAPVHERNACAAWVLNMVTREAGVDGGQRWTDDGGEQDAGRRRVRVRRRGLEREPARRAGAGGAGPVRSVVGCLVYDVLRLATAYDMCALLSNDVLDAVY